MLSQRTTQEGHDAYNIYRAADELLHRVSSHKRSSNESKNITRVTPVPFSAPTSNDSNDL
jgi:hypothetical protein